MGCDLGKRSSSDHFLILDWKGLEEKADEWCRFAAQNPPAAPFCCPSTWLSWYHTHPDFSPMVFEKRERGRLTALVGLYLDGRTLRVPTDEYLDYQDIIAESVDEGIQLLRYVVRVCSEKGWTISFAKVADGSILSRVLRHIRFQETASVQERYWSTCPVQDFSTKEDGGLVSLLSRKKRLNFRRKWKGMAKLFPGVLLEHYSGKEIQQEHIERIAEIHLANQEQRSGESIFQDPGFHQFLRSESADESAMELFLLRAEPGGQVLAFGLGYYGNATFYYYLTGYDAEFSSVSPGYLLLVKMLYHFEDRIEDSSFRLDFLSGLESYKNQWATDCYHLCRIRVIPRQVRNLPLLAAYSTIYSLKAMKNRMLKIG